MEAKKITEVKKISNVSFVEGNSASNTNLIGAAFFMLYEYFQVGNILVEKNGEEFNIIFPFMTYSSDANSTISHYSFIPLNDQDKEEIKSKIIEAYNNREENKKAAEPTE